MTAPTIEQSALVLAWAAIVLLAFALSGLLRQVHALTQAVEGRRSARGGPVTGTTAPAIPGVNGARSAFLLFLDAGCDSCERSLARLADLARQGTAEVAYVALYRGAAPDPAPPKPVLTLPNADHIFASLDVTATPTAVGLGADRRVIASTPVGSPEFVDQFVSYLTHPAGEHR